MAAGCGDDRLYSVGSADRMARMVGGFCFSGCQYCDYHFHDDHFQNILPPSKTVYDLLCDGGRVWTVFPAGFYPDRAG